MSVVSLVQLDHDHFYDKTTPLRNPSAQVTEFGPAIRRIIEDLTDTFLAHKIAVGLAAPQIGIPLRAAVINIDKDRPEQMLTLINPQLIASTGKKDKKKEACMSLPGVQGEVERRLKLNVAYQGLAGEPKILEAKGYLARVLAHEIDHLDGILYVDRMRGESLLERADFFPET